ncbi:MAG: hypothetical protein KGL39_13380 [Patescibacteria group bacterium]|nr:hypothetical protein [Patescibacteria group bacterium]
MPPPNDNLANAQVISGQSSSVIGNNIGATVEHDLTLSGVTNQTEPGYWSNEHANVILQGATPIQGTPVANAIPPSSTVWYKWMPPDGNTYAFECTSDFPSVIQVYNVNSDGTLSGELPYIFNESLGLGGGASYSSRVTLEASLIGQWGAYIRIGGRTWITTGLNAPPQFVSPQGNFTLGWGLWTPPMLGGCNECFDFQSEICSAKQLTINGNEIWQDTDFLQPWETQTSAGYYKLVYCGGGLKVASGTASYYVENGKIVLFTYWYPGIGHLYHYVPGIDGPQQESGFWNLPPKRTLSLLEASMQCQESGWFCSQSDWGFVFTHASFLNGDAWIGGSWPTFNFVYVNCTSTCADLTCSPDPNFGSTVTDQDGVPFTSVTYTQTGSSGNPPGCSWTDSEQDAAGAASGDSPPVYKIVFNPLVAAAFSPVGAGFSSTCGIGGENSDGTHWCYSFTVKNLQNMTWPSVTFNLVAGGGITPVSGTSVTASNITPGQSAENIGPFGFTADIYHQFCSASLSMADGCGFASADTLDFLFYPTVYLRLTGQNLSEVTYNGQKYWRFQVQLTESDNNTPPGWDQSIRVLLISVDAPVTYILNENQTARSQVLPISYVGQGLNPTITFYIQAAAAPVSCNLRIVPQLGVWPYYPMFTVPITINAA